MLSKNIHQMEVPVYSVTNQNQSIIFRCFLLILWLQTRDDSVKVSPPELLVNLNKRLVKNTHTVESPDGQGEDQEGGGGGDQHEQEVAPQEGGEGEPETGSEGQVEGGVDEEGGEDHHDEQHDGDGRQGY